MNELRNAALAGLRWQALAKLGSQVISWAATIVVMRLLAPSDYGLMAMTMVLVGFIALVAEMGLGSALVQSSKADVEQQRTVFGLSICVNLGLYAALAGIAPLAASFFNEPRLVAMALALGVQLPLASMAVVPESMARRDMRFKALGLIELATQLSAVAATVTAAWMDAGAWALVAGQLASAVVKATVMLLVFGTVTPRFRFRQQRGLVAFGGSITLNRIVWYFFSQADTFIAGKLLGPLALGAYSVAVSLANMPMQKIMSVANQVAFSAFSRLQHDKAALSAALLASVRSVFSITLGLLWGLALTAPDLIPLLLGAKWQPAVVPLQIVAIAIPLRVVSAMLSTGLIAAGFVNDDLKNTLTGAAILVPAFYVGATLGGINGLALAWAIGFPVFAVLVCRRIAQRLDFSIGQLLSALWPAVLSGAVMACAILAVRMSGVLASGVLLVLLEVAAGAAAFLLCMYFAARQVLSDVADTLRGRSSRSL